MTCPRLQQLTVTLFLWQSLLSALGAGVAFPQQQVGGRAGAGGYALAPLLPTPMARSAQPVQFPLCARTGFSRSHVHTAGWTSRGRAPGLRIC